MCEPVTIGLMVGGAAISAYSQYEAGQANAKAAEAQAAGERMQAARVEQVGANQAGRVRMAASATASEARTQLAGSGVDVSSGTAPNLFGQSAAAGELDAQTLKQNASLEAWGHRTTAAQFDEQAKVARRNSYLGPLGSALSAGGSIAGYKANLGSGKKAA